MKIIRQIRLFNTEETPSLIYFFFAIYPLGLFPNLKILVLDQPEQQDLLVISKTKRNKISFLFSIL